MGGAQLDAGLRVLGQAARHQLVEQGLAHVAQRLLVDHAQQVEFLLGEQVLARLGRAGEHLPELLLARLAVLVVDEAVAQVAGHEDIDATPSIFEVGGRQIVVLAVGGHGALGSKRGDHVMAFALP